MPTLIFVLSLFLPLLLVVRELLSAQHAAVVRHLSAEQVG